MAWLKKGLKLGGLELVAPMSHKEIQRTQGRELNERNRKKEEDKQQRQYKSEEEAAVHRGRLKYMEREAAKGGGKSGGFWDIGGAVKGIAMNAADASFSPVGGGGRRRGGGMPGGGFTLMSELGPSNGGGGGHRRPARRHHKRVSRRAPSGRPRKVVYY